MGPSTDFSPTTQTPSHQFAATDMNVPKLLRTALFSVLALLLTGGLVAAQAQDTIIVDEDDPDNPDQISAGISAVDEDGDVVAVRAGGYNETLTVNPGFDFVLEARTDDDSGAEAVELDGLTYSDGADQTVTVQSDGTAFFELDGSGTLALASGTVEIDATRDFQILGGATVLRWPNGSISGNSPTFPDNVDVTYDLRGGAQSGDITAGLEAPADIGNGTLTVTDTQTPAGKTVEFPSGRFDTFTASSLAINNDVRADFRGDLTVSNAVSVGSNQSLTVNGTLELGDDQSLTVNSDSDANGDEVDLGNLTLNADVTTASATLVDGAGDLTVNGTTTVQAVSNEGDDDNHIEVTLQAYDGASPPNSGNFDFGIVEETSVDDGSSTDQTFVDIDNSNGGTVTVDGGSIRQIINSRDNANTDGSTFNVDGDLTTEVADDASGNGPFPIENGASGALGGVTTTIDISSGNTLTVLHEGSGTVTHENSDLGGISAGDGTIRFENGDGLDQTVNVSDSDGNANNDVNDLPNVEVAGGNGATFNGQNDDGNGINIDGDLTADASTNLTTSTDGGVAVTGNLTANADVTITTTSASDPANARVGGATTVNGGTTDLKPVAGDVSTGDVVLNNNGILDIGSGQTLEVRRNFDRTSSDADILSNENTTLAFVSQTDGSFDNQTLFEFEGTFQVDKPTATLTVNEAVTVDGDVNIIDPGQFATTTLRLEDNLFLQESTGAAAPEGGKLTVDSNLETEGDEAVVIESAYTVAGQDTLGNVIVRGNSDLTVNPDESANGTSDTALEFTGTLELRDGGVSIASGDGLVPAGPEAEVIRTLDGSNNQVIAGSGTFNSPDNAYNLEYTSTSSSNTAGQTAREVSDGLENLTVSSDTDVLLNSDGAPVPSGDLSDNVLTLNGVLTVESPGTIQEDGDATQTIELAGSGQSHSILGNVFDGTDNPITLDVTGENTTINGSDDFTNDDARIQNVTASASGTTISDVQEIDGNVSVADGGDLTLGLAEAANNGLTDGTAGSSIGQDGAIEGRVTVNDTLSLASNVEVTANATSDAVRVNNTGTNGAIEFEGYDLVITGNGAAFNGGSDASYSSSGGALVFDQQNGGTSQNLTTSGVSLPRIEVSSATDNVTLNGDAATDVLLDLNEPLNLAGNDFEFEGDVEIDADVNATSGIFRALGTTITAESDNSIDNLEVDTDTTSLEVRTDDPATPTPRTLTVDDELTLTSGTLDHAINDVVVNGNGSSDNVAFTSGEVVATSGVLELDVASSGITVTPTSSADDTLSVDNLTVSGGSGNSAQFGDDGLDVEVRSELVLDAQFDGTTGSGAIVIADGVDVERQGNYTERSVLTEAPDLEGTYSLTYTGDPSSSTPSFFRSGRELTSDAEALTDLEVDVSSNGVFLESGSNAVVTGDVTVNGQLNLEDGDLDFGRQVVIADSAEVRRTPNGQLADVDGSGDVPALDAEAFYTLRYDDDSGTDNRLNSTGSSGDFRASELEFLDTGSIALITEVGNPSSAPSGEGRGAVEIPFDRTVETLTVSNPGADNSVVGGGSSVTFLGDKNVSSPSQTTSNTLTVTDSVGVTDGQLEGGTVIDQGDLTITGGSVENFVDIEGNTLVSGGSFNGSLQTAGDVVIGQNGSFGAGTLEFDGTEQDLQLSSTSASAVGQLALSQQNGADGRVYLTGNELAVLNNIDFNSGLLVVPDSVDQSEVLVELSTTTGGNGPGASIPFDRSDVDENDPNDQSHIIGRVRVGVPGGAPNFTVGGTNVTRGRFEFPVGTTEEYRPAAFTFRSDDPTEINTDIVVQHVPMNPQGTEGLPLDAGTDDQGNPVTIGENYPDQYWFVQASTGLGPSQELDAEFETSTASFVDDFEDASQLRLIRRFEGNAQENQWRLQASEAEDAGDDYDNTLKQRDNSEFTEIRSRNSTGGLSASGALFTVGVPTEVGTDVFSIAGSVSYPTVSDGSLVDGRSLSGVAVEASSADTTVTDTTDSNGEYFISGLPSGDYDVTPMVSDSVDNVSTADALRTVRGFAGIDPFVDPFQEQVADVNGNGTTNATDALLIAQFVLGNIDEFDVGAFVTQSESVTLEGESASGVNLFAAETGDVRLNGGETESSQPALSASTISPTSATAATQSSGTSSSVGAEAGKTFEVPVQLDRSATVGSYQLTVDFPSEKASFEGIKGAAQNVLTNASEDGTVKVSWFNQDGKSALDLRSGSDLVTLRFKAAKDVEGKFAPEVVSGEIAGADATPMSAGVEVQAVNIGAPTPDEFALNGNYPNPVRSQATIDMDLPERTDVTVEVYNVLGQRVQTIERTMSAGSGQTIQLDGSNFSSGQYFYRVKANFGGETVQETGRITVVK